MAVDTVHQAGGGAGETQRVIKTIQPILVPHLKKVYESVAGGPDKSWSHGQIQDFLSIVQKHGSQEDLTKLLSRESLGFDEFLTYITSSHGAVTKERKNEDLSWPLASYFISSSHNTYLSGNQLSSDSTTDAYTNVLLRGCRCVEIDVWDGDDSDSESSSDEEKASKDKSTDKKSKRRSAIGKIKGNLPGIASKLRRSTFGKNAGDNEAEDHATKEPAQDAASISETKQSPPAPEVAIVEPKVLHGYTLTKEISFRDVCKAIRDSAFVTTDLPLIVSLEVHCGPAQQLLMVNIMHEIWGEYLVAEPQAEPQVLPSPAELKNKILIKVKYAPPGSSPPTNESDEDDRLPAEPDKKPSENPKSKKPSKITQELSRLGIFTKGISFKSFTQPEASMPTHIFSLAEKKFLDFHEKQREALCNHNRDYLVRAYPSGLRIRSSNLNPPVFWGAGGQIVALNWQQTDEGMMLNEGMFAGTGGYVLKPEGYRPLLKTKPGPNTIIRRRLDLSITFLAAQSIPLPDGDTRASGFEPYVKVEIHVDGSKALQHSEDIDKTDGHEREGEYKARTKTHRGCDLDLAGERLDFKDIPGVVDELTFVRFTVRDDEIGRDDLAAWACVRLDRLGEGYRFIHLIDLEGKLTEGAILVKVEKKLT